VEGKISGRAKRARPEHGLLIALVRGGRAADWIERMTVILGDVRLLAANGGCSGSNGYYLWLGVFHSHLPPFLVNFLRKEIWL
jgi:hypothetical protein